MSSCYVRISCLLEWKFKRQIHHDMNAAEASRLLPCKGPSTSFCIHNFVFLKRIQKIVSSGHPKPGSTPMEMTSPEDLLVKWCGILGEFSGHNLRIKAKAFLCPVSFHLCIRLRAFSNPMGSTGLGQPCPMVAFKPREGHGSQLSNLPGPRPAPAVSTGLLGKGQPKPDDLT